MYRLVSSVTARAAVTTGPAWSGGRRGAHGRPGLPVLGLGWAGGLGLGLGLALGAKLVVGLRGAIPTQSPADPEATAAEQSHEQALGPGSPHTPTPRPPAARGFSRAIESSRDLLHRIKVPGPADARAAASEIDFPFPDHRAELTHSGLLKSELRSPAAERTAPSPLECELSAPLAGQG